MSTASNRLPVIDTSGECLFLVDDDGARELLRSGRARLIRRRGRDRALQATSEIHRDEIRLLGRGTAADHVRYSHNHETPTNPPRVWTHVPQPSRGVFGRVIASVCAAGDDLAGG